jgi:probable phosphoglycerate mutase
MDKKMAKIILIRHGNTQWNIEKRLMGQSDISLSEIGINQLLDFCKSENVQAYQNVSRIFSSPLKRAYTTAYAIASVWQCPVTIQQELIERSFGEYEGVPTQELQKQNNSFNDVIEFLDWSPPRGERIADVYERIEQFITYLVSHTREEETIAIVAHSIPLRVLASILKNVPRTQTLLEPIPEPLSMIAHN